jgi:hypothetical protein
MTTLSITRPGAWKLRSGVLAFTLALFAPLAIPATASASTIPPGGYLSSPQGNEYVNDVSASSPTQGNPAFKVKFELGVGVTPKISAVEHANADAECSGCTAIALGFQVVTTTLNFWDNQLNLKDDSIATTGACAPACTAVADAYQVVVISPTTQAENFGQLLSPGQLVELYDIRSQVLALPDSGLTIDQIQAKAESLAQQVVSILQDGTISTPGFSVFTLPSFSPSVHGVGLVEPELASSNQLIVKLFKSIQVTPTSAG